MLHRPRLLLLDEPSTGLDPGARSDVWQYLEQVRDEDGVTVVLTTHLLEEAERADRIAIMHQGQLVALDTPTAAASGGGRRRDHDSHDATRRSWPPTSASNSPATPRWSTARCGSSSRTATSGSSRLVEAFPDRIDAITLGKPTLEDVFIHTHGPPFLERAEPAVNRNAKKKRR